MFRLILGLSFAAVSFGCGLETQAPERLISVQGTGTVAVEPDVAVVRLGVETRAATSEETLRLNSEKTNSVVAALQALGVEANAIRTESIQLHPRYEHIRDGNGRSSQSLVGYRASNTVRVQLRELSSAGDAIDAASQAGANRIDSIGFEVSDPAAALVAAREAAWQDAKRQAEQLADLAGTGLGEVRNLTTHNTHAGPIQEMALARSAMDSVPISPGQQNVSVHLSVSWSLAQQR